MLLHVLALAALAVASYCDFKTREVPDWLNYSLLAAALGTRLLYTIIEHNPSYFVEGILGFLAFLGIGLLMFYTAQWGGGDAKMLFALGALIGFDLHLNSFLVSFIVNALLAGAFYGLCYSLFLAFRNKKPVLKAYKKLSRNRMFSVSRIFAVVFLFASLFFAFRTPFIGGMLLVLGVLPLLGLYLWIFSKSVEGSLMLKWIHPSKLTVGDWIAKEVKVDGKLICGPKSLGVEKRQITALLRFSKQGKVKRVLVKYGIPFVPSFLAAYILTLIFGNILLHLI